MAPPYWYLGGGGSTWGLFGPPQSGPAPLLPSLTKPGLMNPEQLLIKELLNDPPPRDPPLGLAHYRGGGVGGEVVTYSLIGGGVIN